MLLGDRDALLLCLNLALLPCHDLIPEGYLDNKVESESEGDQYMIFSPYPVVILKTELKVKVNGDQDMMFSPYPANILGHIFALLALNWIAHLLHHILTPAISYKHPLTYSL